MSNTEEKLFVYGTLGPGRPNEHILKNIGGSFERGYVTGVLLEKGWGAEMGYPGIRLYAKGEQVAGFLFHSKNLKNHWSALDEFEGAAYERVLTNVQLKDGTTTEAFIYALKK